MNLLIKVTNNNVIGPDKYGSTWSATILEDGSQAWTQSRDGKIFNGGINDFPRTYSPETEYSSPDSS